MNTETPSFAHQTSRKYLRHWITLALMVLAGCAWLTPLDDTAGRLTDDGLKRALISFATARALNAVISVAQGTEVAVEPAGIGVNFAPGQVLDPLNDLVEHFGDLMLAASIAFGVQKLLLAIGGTSAVSVLLTVMAAACIVLLWRSQKAHARPLPGWSLRILALLILVRFAVPLVSIGNEMLFQAFLKHDYQQSQSAVAAWGGSQDNIAAPPAHQGTLDSVKNWFNKNVDVRERIEKLRIAAEETTEHIITLMAIYLLQTLLIPLGFLWLLVKTVGYLLGMRSSKSAG